MAAVEGEMDCVEGLFDARTLVTVQVSSLALCGSRDTIVFPPSYGPSYRKLNL